MTEIIKKESTEIAKQAEPIKGFDGFDPTEDLIVPRLKLMQKTSPEVEANPDDIKPGDFVNSISGINYGTTAKVVLINITKKRIKFIDVDDGGGIECGSSNGKQPDRGAEYHKNCSDCNHSQWHKELMDGKKQIFLGTDTEWQDAVKEDPKLQAAKTVSPPCTLLFEYPAFILREDNKELIGISFANTSFKAGRELANAAFYRKASVWCFTYELSSKKQTKDDRVWYEITVSNKGYKTEESTILDAEEMYNQLSERGYTVDETDSIVDEQKEQQSVDEKPKEENKKTNVNVDDDDLPF